MAITGEVMCPRPNCDEGPFERLGQHWAKSKNCDHPPLTQRQYEICIGLLMGDGSIGNKRYKNQLIQVEMITKEYLEHLDSIFGILSTGVSLHRTAEENARKHRNSGFDSQAKAENYSDLYGWLTRSHPEITKLTSWYGSGKKVWPKDVDLTPTVLKHWYCGDGCFSNSRSQRHIQIAMLNEIDNEEKVAQYFDSVGLPQPSRWGEYQVFWNIRESEELWEYMLSGGYGIPPGFEYKWPVEYHDSDADTTIANQATA